MATFLKEGLESLLYIAEIFRSKAPHIHRYWCILRQRIIYTINRIDNTVFFANPFGPVQKQKETDILIEKYFDTLYSTGVKVGQIKTCLGVKGQEKNGPRVAALELFDIIKDIKVNIKVYTENIDNIAKKKYEQQAIDAARHRDYNSVEMYVKDKDNISKEITETSKKNEYGNKIKSAFANNSDYEITTSIGTSGSKVGHHYVITEKGKPNETTEIFVAFSKGEAEEFMANAYMIDPRSKARDEATYIASRKKGEGENYNDNMFIPKTLDAQSRANGDGTINVTFCNRTRTVEVGDAAIFKLLINEYKDIKRSIQLKGYFDKNDSIEMANTVNKLADFFGVSNAEAFYNEMQAKDNDLIIYK